MSEEQMVTEVMDEVNEEAGEFDKGFDEEPESGSAEETPPSEEAGSEEGPTTSEEDGGAAGEGGEKSVEVDWKARAEEAERRLASTEKEAKDNHAEFTKRSQELADLKKKVEALESASAGDPYELTPEEQAILDDNPELAGLIDKMAGKKTGDYTSLQETINKLSEAEARRAKNDLLNETNYKLVKGFTREDGKRIEGHADAAEITGSDDFKRWHEEEEAKDPSFKDRGRNAFESGDAETLINILSAYKANRAAKAAEAAETKRLEKSKKQTDQAQASITSAPGGTPQGGKSEGTFEEGFDME